MNKAEIINIRDCVVTHLLPAVPFDGWSWGAVVQAAQEAGYDEDMAAAVFPARIIDVLDAFSDKTDRDMLARLTAEYTPEDMRVRDRVKTALEVRFEILNAHKEAVRESVAFWTVPTRKPRAAQIVWRSADAIWHWAGDEATDYNRYTKRGLLSAIIVPTTLVWLNDADEGMASTRAFLGRRIKNAMHLGGIAARIVKR